MTSISVTFKLFIWAHNEFKKSDKIWGFAEVGSKHYSFWGKRGDVNGSGLKTLQFKRNDDSYYLMSYGKKKLNDYKKDYRSYSVDPGENNTYPEIERVYPGFVAHMRKTLMMARLSGTVKNEGS